MATLPKGGMRTQVPACLQSRKAVSPHHSIPTGLVNRRYCSRPVVCHGGPDIASSDDEVAADPFAWKIRKHWKASDGINHVGSTLSGTAKRPFPGPPPSEGPPLRVLPIGGLGEIGMNCMLVGVKDRYILIDAGLMFPDFQDLGMQKILPDVSFLAQWKDKIEAVVITHGHEDHIGALPWVIPALDPSTPVYAGSFVMQLIARRLQEYNLYTPERYHVIEMLKEYELGPFTVTPIRVTHSIPDCCGLILRSEHGSIVHTGDWKIDEDPVDGEIFDRTTFDLLSKEPISLMMSDSTNVLSPGRTAGERLVQDSLSQKVLDHAGKGRVVVTQFASNLHRLASVKAAADAAGRQICFIGTSLNTYLEAAYRDGRAPLSPSELIKPDQLPHMDPNKVLIVTTGSQAEPRAQLSLAARSASQNLKISPQDLILYSAKVIPGNETKVSQMLNSLAMQGARVVAGRADNLHVSGHAYQGELEEVLRYVKPQHFLPVHGEYSFLVEHARLAKEKAGIHFTEVIKNGQMLGIYERRNRNTLSTGSMATATLKQQQQQQEEEETAEEEKDAADAGGGIKVIGEVDLLRLFNDGSKGTGTAAELAMGERESLAFEGIVVVAVDVMRPKQLVPGGDGNSGLGLSCRARLTTRAMWTDQGRLLDVLHQAVQSAVSKLPGEASLGQVERQVMDACLKAARWFNNRKPEVIVVAYDHDPRAGALVDAAVRRREQSARQAAPAAAAVGPAAGPPTRRTARLTPARAAGAASTQQQRPAPLQQQQQAAVQRPIDSSSSSSGLVRPPVRRTRRSSSAAAAAQPPPLQVLPDGVKMPTVHENPRVNPPADAADRDLSYG